jgi:hypothetical protein
MDKIYLVFERNDNSTNIIAKIVGEELSGVQAVQIEKLLRGTGWPARSPDRILHWSICWAVEQKQDEP